MKGRDKDQGLDGVNEGKIKRETGRKEAGGRHDYGQMGEGREKVMPRGRDD